MFAPRVSVIIPSYNHEAFVGEAIESVLNQDFQDYELLIADDHSSDHSVDVIKTYTDKRIRTFFLNENLGATGILKFLIEHARGEYIALLNSDDRWCPGKLSKQYAFLEKNQDYAACFTWADFIDEHGNPIKKDSDLDLHMFIRENRTQYAWLNFFFYNGNCLCHPSILIRKSVYDTLGYYNGAYRQLPDFEYWIRLCVKYPIYIIEEVLVNHRRTTGENENTSAVSTDNSKRSLSELVSIFSWLFTHVDDEVIIKAFQGNFIRRDAHTSAEIVCEKYFLMANNPVFGSVIKNQACQYFMNHYLDDGVADCFKETYNYSQSDFYADNILSYAGYEKLFKQEGALRLLKPVCRFFRHILMVIYSKYIPDSIKKIYRKIKRLCAG